MGMTPRLQCENASRYHSPHVASASVLFDSPRARVCSAPRRPREHRRYVRSNLWRRAQTVIGALSHQQVTSHVMRRDPRAPLHPTVLGHGAGSAGAKATAEALRRVEGRVHAPNALGEDEGVGRFVVGSDGV